MNGLGTDHVAHCVVLLCFAAGVLITGCESASQQADTLYDRARTLHEQGNYDEAIADYTAAISFNPEHLDAYICRGAAWANQGEFDKTIADCDEALRLRPGDAYALHTRANAWREKGNYDKAIADCTESLKHDPSAEGYINRANTWYDKGDFDQAIADFNEALELNPMDVRAYSVRGNAWREQGNYDKAISDYNNSLRIDSTDVMAHRGMTWILATCPKSQHRNGEKAVVHAETACRLTKWSDVKCIAALAAAYAESGDFEKAVEWQAKAHDMYTEHDKRQWWGTLLALYKSGKPFRDKRPQ